MANKIFQKITRFYINLSDFIESRRITGPCQCYSKQINTTHEFLFFLFSIEDKRFSRHFGIDLIAIIRAALMGLFSKRRWHGASTITQQLYYIIGRGNRNKRRTFSEKFYQCLWAIKTESFKSKEYILQEYLNNAYFGKNYYGLDMASNKYFNKQKNELTCAQAFFLAERLARPNKISPQRIEDLLNRYIIKRSIKENGLNLGELNKIYQEVFFNNQICSNQLPANPTISYDYS